MSNGHDAIDAEDNAVHRPARRGLSERNQKEALDAEPVAPLSAPLGVTPVAGREWGSLRAAVMLAVGRVHLDVGATGFEGVGELLGALARDEPEDISGAGDGRTYIVPYRGGDPSSAQRQASARPRLRRRQGAA